MAALLLSFFLLLSFSHAFLLPVTKDGPTRQYLTRFFQHTPPVPIKLTVDLGGPSLWLRCEAGHSSSSSYRPAHCRNELCSGANPTNPRCGSSNRCNIFLEDPITRGSKSCDLAQELLALQSPEGRPNGIPQFLLACSPPFLLRGLAAGVQGVIGLGRSRIALPSQLAAASGFDRKFAICLPSTTESDGAIFLGDGPYLLHPGDTDITKSLMYTPLIFNPAGEGELSHDENYYIGVKSIKVAGRPLPVNASLLSIDQTGRGGTKISSISAFTSLETTIYETLVDAFIAAASRVGIARTAPLAPFGACFSVENVTMTSTGPAVPAIELVLQSETVRWKLHGANSMVFVKKDVMCLAFVNGGRAPRTSIVLGGHQLEDNLLQFDLGASRFGFSSSLLARATACSSTKILAFNSATS